MPHDLFQKAAADHPGRVALRHDGADHSYEDVAAAVERLASILAALRLEAQRVAVLLPNHPLVPVALHGIWRVGGSAVLLNPMSSPREVRENLATSGACATLTVEALGALLPEGFRSILLDGFPGSVPVNGDPIPPGAPEATRHRGVAPPDAEAAVLFTAADDGYARGARLSHGNLTANLLSTVEAMNPTRRACWRCWRRGPPSSPECPR